MKYASSFALILVAFLFIGSSSVASVAAGATCNLTKVQIAGGTLTATTEKITITATPSCWSGQVGVNRGNIDYHLITVTVTSGQGTGILSKIGTTQEVHPYASGVRGNNIIIPCACVGTGLAGLSIAQTKLTATTETITITATPSTWAGTVNIVNSAGASPCHS